MIRENLGMNEDVTAQDEGLAQSIKEMKHDLAAEYLSMVRTERWHFGIIGFCLGMLIMSIIKGDNLPAFWKGLTGE